MRINDFHNILELVKQDILKSEAEYLKLLKVVGNNQRYDFRSQLSIYDRNPEATACAKLDYWRDISGKSIDATIQKSKELDKEVLRGQIHTHFLISFYTAPCQSGVLFQA